MVKKKKLLISCEGSMVIDFQKLHPMQGNLKTLAKQDMESMIKLMEKHGYSFPIKVWEDNKNKMWIIGGHQTFKVLTEMKAQGYEIPMIPIVLIKAKTKKEARKLILVDASAYGKINKKGLKDFILDDEMDLGDFAADFRLPDLDLPSFNKEFFFDGVVGEIINKENKCEEQPQEPQPNDTEVINLEPQSDHNMVPLIPEKKVGDEEPLPPNEPPPEDHSFRHDCPRCGYRFD